MVARLGGEGDATLPEASREPIDLFPRVDDEPHVVEGSRTRDFGPVQRQVVRTRGEIDIVRIRLPDDLHLEAVGVEALARLGIADTQGEVAHAEQGHAPILDPLHPQFSVSSADISARTPQSSQTM